MGIPQGNTISLEGVVVSKGTLTIMTPIVDQDDKDLTIDMLLGGLILRDPDGADRIDSIPTAESIVSDISGAVVGSSFEFRIKNTSTNTNNTITISGPDGGNVTTNGTMTIQPLFTRTFLVVCDNVTNGKEAVTIYSLGTLAP